MASRDEKKKEEVEGRRQAGREGAPSGLCRISYCIIQWQVSYITYKWRGGGIMREGGAVKSQFYDIMRYPLRVEGRRGGGGGGHEGRGGRSRRSASQLAHMEFTLWPGKFLVIIYFLGVRKSSARGVRRDTCE